MTVIRLVTTKIGTEALRNLSANEAIVSSNFTVSIERRHGFSKKVKGLIVPKYIYFRFALQYFKG